MWRSSIARRQDQRRPGWPGSSPPGAVAVPWVASKTASVASPKCAPGRHAGPADQPGAELGHEVAVHVRQHQDVEPVGRLDQLHRERVDDPVARTRSSGTRSATRRATSRNRPSENFMMFALCAAMTCVPVVVARPVEREPHDPLAPELRDVLHADAGSARTSRPVRSSMNPISSAAAGRAHLDLDPRVHALGVLADDHDVDVLVRRGHARVQAAGPDVRVQVQALAQRHVRAPQARRDRRLDRTLQRDARRPEGRERGRRQRVAGPGERAGAHVLAIPLDRRRRSLRATRRAASIDLGTDAVARDQRDAVRHATQRTQRS